MEPPRRKWTDLCPIEKGSKKMGLKFQVADVVKPLIAVKRLTEKGNVVHFGPREEDCYIQNVSSGSKLALKPNGPGSYLMFVKFEGGMETEIVVDSGAEENVCPKWWGSSFGLDKADKQLHLRSAGGNVIEHYGQRAVIVTSPF